MYCIAEHTAELKVEHALEQPHNRLMPSAYVSIAYRNSEPTPTRLQSMHCSQGAVAQCLQVCCVCVWTVNHGMHHALYATYGLHQCPLS